MFAEIIERDHLVAVLRIAFSIIAFFKFAVTFDAKRLIWSHRLPFKSEKALNTLLLLLICSTVFLGFGFIQGPTALALYLLYLFLFHYSSLYCLEDVLFHTHALYFVLAAPSAAYSLDSLFGDSLFGMSVGWERPLGDNLLPEIFLSIAVGTILFSAGVEKLKSKLWRKGLATYYFFLLPNVRRLRFTALLKSKKAMIAMNHLTLLMETGLLPVICINAHPFGILFWLLAVGFTITLSLFFVVHWIGECQLLGLAVAGWLLINSGEGLTAIFVSEICKLTNPGQYLLAGALVLTLVCAVLTVCFPSAPNNKSLLSLHRLVRTIARYSWGMLAIKAFTEMHLKGPVVYRVMTKDKQGKLIEAWPIFNERAQPGRARRFKPTFFETMAYKVTEFCIELDAFGEIKSKDRYRFFCRFNEYIREKSQQHLGFNPESLTFTIVQIDVPDSFIGPSEWYLNDGWRKAYEVFFDSDGRFARVEKLSDPILPYETGRELDRSNFSFA